jgi:hypothetical protein
VAQPKGVAQRPARLALTDATSAFALVPPLAALGFDRVEGQSLIPIIQGRRLALSRPANAAWRTGS